MPSVLTSLAQLPRPCPVVADEQTSPEKVLSASALTCLSLDDLRRGNPREVVVKHGSVIVRVRTSVRLRLSGRDKEMTISAMPCTHPLSNDVLHTAI